MKITKGACKSDTEQVIVEGEALNEGMEEKSKEFVENGAEVFRVPGIHSPRLTKILPAW